jgi:hypothetical protein
VPLQVPILWTPLGTVVAKWELPEHLLSQACQDLAALSPEQEQEVERLALRCLNLLLPSLALSNSRSPQDNK